jgi:hypothetical protein
MTPQEFLEPGYKLAYSLLRDEESFPPFVVVLGDSGRPACVMPEDGSVNTVKAEIRRRAVQASLELAALFTMGRALFEGESEQRLVVSVHLDAPGLNRLILTPYALTDGNLSLGTPLIMTASEALIPRAPSA